MNGQAAIGAVFSGPLGEQLHRRLEETTAAAHQTLAIEPSAARATTDELAELRRLIDDLNEMLPPSPAQREHEAALERLRHRFETRSDALTRAQAAVAELREITLPSAMLARAPAALCDRSTLTRAILSVVRDGHMVAEAVHVGGDPAGAAELIERLREAPVALDHALVEKELLRRRRATIVLDAQVNPGVDRRTAELMAWRSYVAAPLVIGPHVIGVIHADRGPSQTIDVLEREVLWEFATGLAQAYESASLRRTLRREREQMRHFLEWIGARSGELSDAPITLQSRPAPSLPPADTFDGPAPQEGRDDRVVFAGLLTRRELDVLRLLAEGATNRAIADALVLSDATVKFHVNRILRKLHVSNRAEAVSRYLTLLGLPPP
jgi:LuxR family transcriptional regulator, regulator of acetate metabolism